MQSLYHIVVSRRSGTTASNVVPKQKKFQVQFPIVNKIYFSIQLFSFNASSTIITTSSATNNNSKVQSFMIKTPKQQNLVSRYNNNIIPYELHVHQYILNHQSITIIPPLPLPPLVPRRPSLRRTPVAPLLQGASEEAGLEGQQLPSHER